MSFIAHIIDYIVDVFHCLTFYDQDRRRYQKRHRHSYDPHLPDDMNRKNHATNYFKAISPSRQRVQTTHAHSEQSSGIRGRQRPVEHFQHPSYVDTRSGNTVSPTCDGCHEYDAYDGRRTHYVSQINPKMQQRHQRVKTFPQTRQNRTYQRDQRVSTSMQHPVVSHGDAVYRRLPGVNNGGQGKQGSAQQATKRYLKRSNIDY